MTPDSLVSPDRKCGGKRFIRKQHSPLQGQEMEKAMIFIREAAWCSKFMCQERSVPNQAVSDGLVNNPRTWGQFPLRSSIPTEFL